MHSPSRLSFFLFLALLIVCTFHILATIGDLPDRVAIHFAADGSADAWASREWYRSFILLALIGLPLLLVWMMGTLPRLRNGRGQVPNCDYWFARDRRKETEAFLVAHAYWLGCMTVAVIYGIHISILRANTVSPPSLGTNRFITMILFYVCGLAWWMAAFLRHFRI